MELIWKIYYDFYAVLNPLFEQYLINNIKKIGINGEKYISIIINNLMIRPHSLDIFILRQFVSQFDFDTTCIEYTEKPSNSFECIKREFNSLLETEDYNIISYMILKEIKDEHLLDALLTSLIFFINLGVKIDETKVLQDCNKIIKNTPTNIKRNMVLSKIILYYGIYKNKNTQFISKKYISISVDDEDIITYKNKYINLQNKDFNKAYKIIPLEATHEIDEHCYLSLFCLKRDKLDIRHAYLNNWLYYASFSPIWLQRIKSCNGSIDSLTKKVVFETEEYEEKFYEEYGYEPDEQKIEVQNKSIQQIYKKRNWLSFYKARNKNQIIDIDNEMIQDIEKIAY